MKRTTSHEFRGSELNLHNAGEKANPVSMDLEIDIPSNGS